MPGSTDVLVADRENSRLQLFDGVGRFKRQWRGVADAQTTGRVFAVAADAEGALYVGVRREDYDTKHTGVLKLDREWKIVAAIGFGQAQRPGVQRRARPGGRAGRVDLRGRDPDQAGRETSCRDRPVTHILARGRT